VGVSGTESWSSLSLRPESGYTFLVTCVNPIRMDEDISEYVDSTEEILQASNSGGQRGLNEQATCESIITRFISALGWDEIDKQRPFRVQMGRLPTPLTSIWSQRFSRKLEVR